jgi:hypothetical protein
VPGRRYGGYSVGGRYVRVSRRHQAAGPGCAVILAVAAMVAILAALA